MDERDIRRAVRIVFDRRDGPGHPVLVTLEVDPTVAALVSTPASTRRHVSVMVAAAAPAERLRQRALGPLPRHLFVLEGGAETLSRSDWLEFLDGH